MDDNMKTYIGVKIIDAQTMKLGEYKRFSGHPLEDFEKPEWDGYMVRYPDGYISWSPKETFEEAYREKHGLTFGLAIEAMKKGYKVARAGWNGKGIFIGIQKGFDIEEAAAKSHESYVEQKRKQGITSRKSEDGEELMVPYADLSEKQKEMDRAYAGSGDEMTHDFIFIDTTGLITDNPKAPKNRVPWLASQTDMLSEDWMVIE